MPTWRSAGAAWEAWHACEGTTRLPSRWPITLDRLQLVQDSDPRTTMPPLPACCCCWCAAA